MTTHQLDVGPGIRRICKLLAEGGILVGERHYPSPMRFSVRKTPDTRTQTSVTDSMIARMLDLGLVSTGATVPDNWALDVVCYTLTPKRASVCGGLARGRGRTTRDVWRARGLAERRAKR